MQFLNLTARVLFLSAMMTVPDKAFASCLTERLGVRQATNEAKPINQIAAQLYEIRKQSAGEALQACLDQETEASDRDFQQTMNDFKRGLEADQRAYDAEMKRIDDQVLSFISNAVLEGRCNDARYIALKLNRLDLADQAMRLCSPAPKQSAEVKPAPQQSKIVKPAANNVLQKQPVAVKPVATNSTPVSIKARNSGAGPSGLLSAEQIGQGQTMCFYENQRRLTVATGKTCPFSHPFR